MTIAISAVVVTACGGDEGGNASAPVSSSTVSSSEASIAEETAELAPWQTIEIADVDGATFSLADYVGTPVLVETFATWCVNCRAQLGDTQQAAVTLGEEAAVVALSVETDLSSGDVAEYAADNGFADIRFAVMTPELLAAFADAFGTTVANPPSTPKVIIDAMGHAGDLSTGPERTDDLVTEVRAAAA
jgi:cytochrome oxidase Cu insertion factor (SCO1/SenC/PrrC family)